MQLVQIKTLRHGKFYLSHKEDHTFIKGNPSSHKEWMSRFIYVKWAGKKRNPWRCEMSWGDNLYTLTPRTPERSPNLTSFLDAMRDKSYNAPELIKEDLLCFFGLSRKGVGLVRNLGTVVPCLIHVTKTAVEVELDKTKARAAEEFERLKGEATNALDLGKEEFLKSSEFDNLFAKKFVAFFKTGFESCVAQFRANGYFNEEYPASFLSVRRALEESPDDA
ncbi:hypothetical protein F511_24428 [Dorcoceras hygrometricum]|uniref:Uncharacterized protein n=1 Tax=Dorcoceras hygrometricum TaxID=472368 RepID=A0A2Z7D0I6_9LAMI|nr:hypothetical protein F511_24428 [Dorcoceras hygrometricum]